MMTAPEQTSRSTWWWVGTVLVITTLLVVWYFHPYRTFVPLVLVHELVYDPPYSLAPWTGTGHPPTALVYPIFPEADAYYRFEVILSGTKGTNGSIVSDLITANVWNPPESATWLPASALPASPHLFAREFVATGSVPAITQLRTASLSDAIVQVHRMRLLRTQQTTSTDMATYSWHSWRMVLGCLCAIVSCATFACITWPGRRNPARS